MGFSFKKLGRFLDPTKKGSLGNQILGSIPLVGDTLKGGAEIVGTVGQAVKPDGPRPPAPTPYQPPNSLAPSGTATTAGGLGAMLKANPAIPIALGAVALVVVVLLVRRR